MEIDKDILIDGVIINCAVVFSRYREPDEDSEIVIDSIKHNGFPITYHISDEEMEKLKYGCEKCYQYRTLQWMQERDDLG